MLVGVVEWRDEKETWGFMVALSHAEKTKKGKRQVERSVVVCFFCSVCPQID